MNSVIDGEFCPLCEAQMPPNMIKVITTSFGNNASNRGKVNDLGFDEIPNTWSTFLRRFRNT